MMTRKCLVGMGLGAFALLAGCQANYMADVHNQTAAPIFAQLMIKANDRSQGATLGAARRLGPGDRAAVGPVRANKAPGSVYLSVDSMGNPARPSTADLNPGTAFVVVTQEEGGPLRIAEKP